MRHIQKPWMVETPQQPLNSKKNKKIPIKKSIRKGDTVSLKLFMGYVEYFYNLRFADDIVILNESENLQRIIEELNSESKCRCDVEYEENQNNV